MPQIDLTNAKSIRIANRDVLNVVIGNYGVWSAEAHPTAVGAASDTTVTIGGEDYRVITFTADGALDVFAPIEVEYLVVGGGGQGARGNNLAWAKGGGAGGEVLHNVGGAPLTLPPGLHGIRVGPGGNNPSQSTSSNGAAGGVSSLGDLVVTTAASGGAGPGGNQTTVTNGAHTGGAHYNGAAGGGGPGAGEDGEAATPTSCGKGGDGVEVNIDGNPRHFGGGGGGGGNETNFTPGPGGLGGGTDGVGTGASDAAAPNTGGGSGGSRSVAGPGGSGIVIVRYKL